MGSTPVAYIDETGIHVPDFPTVWQYFQDAYRGIYGSDVYLGNDSQDGQLLGIFAAAINDANNMALQVYNSYSPATAQGTGLSSVVKINGIARKVPSRSSVDVVVGGIVGTIITNGIARDETGGVWNLPPLVEIPFQGQTTITATASVLGEQRAPAGAINEIVNTQPGWQTVFNIVDATPGLPIETDALLRVRQSISTEIPSEGILEGLVGALWELPDIRRLAVFENTLWAPDINGIPGHCIAAVIDGGDSDRIADIIMAKKGGGVGTYGIEVFPRMNRWGIPHQVAFFRPIQVPITWIVTLRTFTRYTMNTEQAIARAVSDWTNALGIGTNVRRLRALVPANLGGGPGSETFEPLKIECGRDGQGPAEADIVMAFNEEAITLPQYVQFRYPEAH